MTAAALFVETGGVYFGLPGIEPWDETRDARRYAGPWPVVAHPPCQRWGRFWHGSTRKPHQFELGDDGGCFAAALRAVVLFGGVLEHPADSKAFTFYDLPRPIRHDAGAAAGRLGSPAARVGAGRGPVAGQTPPAHHGAPSGRLAGVCASINSRSGLYERIIVDDASDGLGGKQRLPIRQRDVAQVLAGAGYLEGQLVGRGRQPRMYA